MDNRIDRISDPSIIEAADASVDLYYQLFNNLYDGLSIFEVKDNKVKALYLNERYFDTVGYTKEQYIPYVDNITVTLFEKDEEEIFRLAEESIKTGKPFYYEAQGYRFDNSVGWFSIRARVVDFIKSSGTVFLASITDVSDRKHLENKLAVDRERYRILEETTSEFLFEYIIAEDKMIFSPGKNIPEKVIENYNMFVRKSPLVYEGDIDIFISALNKACHKKIRGCVEYRTRVIDETQFKWCRTYYSSVADEHGNVISVLGRIQDISDEISRINQIQHLAETDNLTDMLNKTAAVEKIESEIENRNGSGFMIVADIDNFKYINDRYGHNQGDVTLKNTAELLKKHFSDGIIGRFGGDEFIIYIYDVSEAELHDKAEQLLKETKSTFYTAAPLENPSVTEKYAVTLSIGASWHPTFGSDRLKFNDYFITADKAMYKAKKDGKNCMIVDKIVF